MHPFYQCTRVRDKGNLDGARKSLWQSWSETGLAPRMGQVVNRQLFQPSAGLPWTLVSTSRDQICQGPRSGRRCSTSSPPQVNLHFGRPCRNWSLVSVKRKVVDEGPFSNRRPSPHLCAGWGMPIGSENTELMFPFLVDATQRWRKGGLYCLPACLPR